MKTNTYIKGILLGVLLGVLWGLDSVLMEQMSSTPILSNLETAMAAGISETTFHFSPLVTAFFHESFCFIWVALFLLMRKQLKHSFYILFRTKRGLATAIAALVGSPIGMSAYLLGIKFAGAPYASSISVIYPGIGAVISYFVLKEKISVRAMVGIGVSLIGSFMLSFNPSTEVPDTFMIGILFSGIAVLGWALEGVIIGWAMKHIKGEEQIQATPQQLLCIRYFVAMIAYGAVVLPIIKGYSLAGAIVQQGLVLPYAGIAILGALTYLAWYKAVDLIGSALGTALNSTAALWTIIFSALLLNTPLTPALAIWGIVTVVGVFIFAVDPSTLSKKNPIQILPFYKRKDYAN